MIKDLSTDEKVMTLLGSIKRSGAVLEAATAINEHMPPPDELGDAYHALLKAFDGVMKVEAALLLDDELPSLGANTR
jgi:hypothetical protein